MNKTILLIVALFVVLPTSVYSQTTTTPKDTLPSLDAGDIEDDFAASLEKPKKIIIVDQKDVLTPREYVQKERKFFYEQAPVMQNENFAIIDLPEQYSGFKIELIRIEEEPLPDDDIIFFRHGNVVEEVIDENTFTYLIGDFETEPEAAEFMEIFLADLYPEARIVAYQNGQRF